jgi:hypothetical protein
MVQWDGWSRAVAITLDRYGEASALDRVPESRRAFQDSSSVEEYLMLVSKSQEITGYLAISSMSFLAVKDVLAVE